jgi:fused signal recognition particle receptor
VGWFKRKKDPAPGESPAEGTAAEQQAPDGAAPEPEAGGRGGVFRRLRERLTKTRRSFSEGMDRIFSGKTRVDAGVLEDLEELLITSDMGVKTAAALMERLGAAKAADVAELRAVLREEVLAILSPAAPEPPPAEAKPRVVMVVGVNGVGKTTTIGKLAARWTAAGATVLIAAADTFRAAAVDQLAVWAERAGAEIVRHKHGTDPAAVAFDALEAGMARGVDVVIVDTAGRLHTKVNLMEEVKKVKRSLAKKMPGAPHEVLLVLDATTGQNAISQARLFHEALDITGIALTKLDGTAKGGIVIAVCGELGIPLRYIGIGEGIDDLQDFDAARFADALFAA